MFFFGSKCVERWMDCAVETLDEFDDQRQRSIKIELQIFPELFHSVRSLIVRRRTRRDNRSLVQMEGQRSVRSCEQRRLLRMDRLDRQRISDRSVWHESSDQSDRCCRRFVVVFVLFTVAISSACSSRLECPTHRHIVGRLPCGHFPL